MGQDQRPVRTKGREQTDMVGRHDTKAAYRHQGAVHDGIEMFVKKPFSVWLRTLGKGTEKVSNWETSSNAFKYDFVPAILMPDVSSS